MYNLMKEHGLTWSTMYHIRSFCTCNCIELFRFWYTWACIL